jgi:hypothetical protein
MFICCTRYAYKYLSRSYVIRKRSRTDGSCEVCLTGRCATPRMAHGAETCSSLTRVVNYVTLTAFVDCCIDCKDYIVIRSFDFRCTRFYKLGSRQYNIKHARQKLNVIMPSVYDSLLLKVITWSPWAIVLTSVTATIVWPTPQSFWCCQLSPSTPANRGANLWHDDLMTSAPYHRPAVTYSNLRTSDTNTCSCWFCSICPIHFNTPYERKRTCFLSANASDM